MLDYNQSPLTRFSTKGFPQTSNMSPLLRFECKKLLAFHRFPQQKAKGDSAHHSLDWFCWENLKTGNQKKGLPFLFIFHPIKIGKP